MPGGAGARLWPLSTEHQPKQFHALASERTMLQDTVLRMLQQCEVDFLAR
jgi:mannose-1-phosphate guanylyltransferase